MVAHRSQNHGYRVYLGGGLYLSYFACLTDSLYTSTHTHSIVQASSLPNWIRVFFVLSSSSTAACYNKDIENLKCIRLIMVLSIDKSS